MGGEKAPRRDERHGAAQGPTSGVSSARTAARHHAVLDLTMGELFKRACRELLLVRRAIAGKLIEHARELGRDEHAEILVGRVLRYVGRSKNLHASVALAENVNFFFELRDEHLDLRLDLMNPVVSQSFRIDNGVHLIHRAVEIVVHHHIVVAPHFP